MARTARAPLDGAQSDLSAEDQALMAQMQADDAAVDDTLAPAPQQTAVGDAPADDAGADDQQQQKPNRMVPLGALHEERERRKQAEAAIAEERRRMQTLEERTNLLLQRFAQPQQAQPDQQQQPAAVPDLNVDPVGHITGSIEQVRQQLAQIQASGQATQQQIAQANAIQQLQQQAYVREMAFRADNPDYDQAITYLRKQRDAELAENGFADPMQRQAMITQEALGLAAMALQNGRDPAAVVYNIAKTRGYQVPQADPQPNGAGNGAAQPTAADRLAQVAAGQQQARGLSGARGSGPAPLTAQRLLEMSDKDFDKMMETDEGRALLGA